MEPLLIPFLLTILGGVWLALRKPQKNPDAAMGEAVLFVGYVFVCAITWIVGAVWYFLGGVL